MNLSHQELLDQTAEILRRQPDVSEATQAVCAVLHENLPNYDWVGFYWAEGHQMLRLGSYVGAPTDHVLIPYGKGICGQVAVSEETMIVADVSASDNYIACSVDVKSEIVVPIMKNGAFVGQIDIDSHHLNAFSVEDQRLLEAVCAQISDYLS